MPLTNKVAIITGATGPLGPVVSRAFANAGAKLALVATSADELAALASELGFPESRVFWTARDLFDEASATALADSVIEHYGRADILVHLVGGYQSGALAGLELETWEYMINLNLRAAMNLLRVFLPYVTANGWGRIVTLSSVLAERPSVQSAAYSAAKAGSEALTLAAAQEVRDKGATANVIVIKTLDTPDERARSGDAKTAGWVKPEEVAALLLFLCSDEAGAINGARIPMYGRGQSSAVAERALP
jgi:NAD(P)-dependent dehydrogenase (short-subunit alcohol dehydrogenase family)